MPLASEKYVTKKLNRNRLNLTSDESILFELQKHVDTFTLNNRNTKIYFNDTDFTMDTKTKLLTNSIIPGYIPEYHCHDYYEFNIVFEGKCIEIINGISVSLEKGDILILPSGTAFHTHYLKLEGKGCNILVKSSHITSLRDELSEIKDNFLDKLLKKNGFCIIHTEKNPETLKDMSEILSMFETCTPPSALSRMYAENTFNRMILQICRGMENGEIICDFSATVPKAPSSEEIITYIKDNYATLSTSELSRKFGYSERQLNRIIKKHTGSGFASLIIYERIAHAKNLLKNTSLSIAEISKAVGLDSKEYFCNMFKKQTSMTPTDYRKITGHTGN